MVAADGELQCRGCDRTYRARMGQLFPVGRAHRTDPRPPRPDGGDVMRIAQVAPLYEAVPPGAYGGTERVIATLCDGLVAQGHDVTLFAPETSDDRGEAGGVRPAAARSVSAGEELVDLAPHLHLQMLADALPATRRVRRRALPPRHLDAAVHHAVRDAHGADHARPARPRLPAGPAAALRVGAAGLHQRRPAAGGRRPRSDVGGHGLQRARPRGVRGRAARPRRLPRLRRAASRRRRARSPPSRSPAAPALPLRMAAKVDPLDERLLRAGGEAADGAERRLRRGDRRARASPRSTPARGRRSSPATGRSRSAWS